MFIDYDITVEDLKMKIRNGEKHFYRIDFGQGIAKGENFDNVVFEECILCMDFSNSSFINTKFLCCNIKTCIFKDADLSNATIENSGVESINLTGAKLDGLVFENNGCYSGTVNQEDLYQFID